MAQCRFSLFATAPTEHLGTLRRLTGKWADPRSASILACDRGVPQFSRKLEACATLLVTGVPRDGRATLFSTAAFAFSTLRLKIGLTQDQ